MKVTSHFVNGKILIFAKISPSSFVYVIIDVFCCPPKYVKDIFSRNDFMKCFVYLILTDTDIASLLFVFICKLDWSITEDQARHLLFQILFETKILEWLETPDKFWEKFNVCNLKLKKQVGLYD